MGRQLNREKCFRALSEMKETSSQKTPVYLERQTWKLWMCFHCAQENLSFAMSR